MSTHVYEFHINSCRIDMGIFCNRCVLYGVVSKTTDVAVRTANDESLDSDALLA